MTRSGPRQGASFTAQNDPGEPARTIETLRKELGADRLETLLSAGQALTVPETIAAAFVLAGRPNGN